MKKLLTLIISFALFIPIVLFAAELNGTSLISSPNLKAYYRLTDFNDNSGNAVNLTNNGGVTTTTGKYGFAADFGASNTTKSLTATNNLGIGGTSSTLVGWVNITTQPATNALYSVISQGDATTNDGFILYYRDISGVKNLTADRLRGGIADDLVNYATTLNTGTWYHVAQTYNSTNSLLSLYLNGSLVATTTSSGNGNAGVTSGIGLGINIAQAAGPARTSGLVDDMAFFNRELSANEISTLYTDVVAPTSTNPIQVIWIDY